MKVLVALVSFFVVAVAECARADTFGGGPLAFDIEFVMVGDVGNFPDTTGNPNPVGAVPYRYRIGKHEVSEDMIIKMEFAGGPDVGFNARGLEKPVRLSWFKAAKFINWLNTSTGNTPAYKFEAMFDNFQAWTPSDLGYNPTNPFRNSRAKYFLPSVDEWYKAAYYDPSTGTYYDYPTGSDTAPASVASGTLQGTAVYAQTSSFALPADVTQAGGLSTYGTMGQGGNEWEWEETESDLLNNSSTANRGVRGGGFNTTSPLALSSPFRSSISPTAGDVTDGGFAIRVASVVPEPSTLLILVSAFVAACISRGRLQP